MDPLERAAVGRAHAALAAIYPSPRVELISDEADLQREARVLFLCANRLGVAVRDDSTGKIVGPRDNHASPFLGHSLSDLAEDSLRRAGVSTRGMAKAQIVAAAIGHTTSDFPRLLENTAHKLLVASYNRTRSTWRSVCRLGDLTDFRVHNRFRFGGFSDLKTVNEAGRYEQGTIADAEKETITGVRKGRILTVTREMIVNDDLQALSDAARELGNVASRTIDKDLYALLPLNSGDGPTMSDGQPLFDATHGNIHGTAGAPTTALVDGARVLLAQQQDPGATDYIDLRPSIAWCPLALGSTMRLLNEAQYDPESSKFEKPNVCRGLFRDVVDSPRLDAISATAWYVLADPNEEPVFEVGFIGGMQEPRVEQEREFSSDSLQWKVVHEYGVAAIGWRGIVRNAGA